MGAALRVIKKASELEKTIEVLLQDVAALRQASGGLNVHRILEDIKTVRKELAELKASIPVQVLASSTGLSASPPASEEPRPVEPTPATTE